MFQSYVIPWYVPLIPPQLLLHLLAWWPRLVKKTNLKPSSAILHTSSWKTSLTTLSRQCLDLLLVVCVFSSVAVEKLPCIRWLTTLLLNDDWCFNHDTWLEILSVHLQLLAEIRSLGVQSNTIVEVSLRANSYTVSVQTCIAVYTISVKLCQSEQELCRQ